MNTKCQSIEYQFRGQGLIRIINMKKKSEGFIPRLASLAPPDSTWGGSWMFRCQE